MATAYRGFGYKLLTVALLLFANVAAAQSATVSWLAPSGCPSEAAVQSKVETLRRARGIELSAVRARAAVRERGGVFALELQIARRDQRAERRLEAASCDELADATAWLIVVGHEARSGAHESSAQPAGATTLASPGTSEREAPAEPQNSGEISSPPSNARAEQSGSPAGSSDASARHELDAFSSSSNGAHGDGEPPSRGDARTGPPTDARMRAHWPHGRWARVGVLGGVWAAGLPAPQAMIGVSGGVGVGWLYAELRFVHVLERAQSFALERRASFYSDQFAGLACGLFDFARQRLRGGPCLELSAVRTSGSALGTTDPETRAYYWALAGASAQLAMLLFDPLELIVEGGASVPLRKRPRFWVAGRGDVAEAALFSPYASLALGARW